MVIGKLYKEYQNRLKSANALDFDDLIYKTVELLESFPEELEYYQNRFRYIMVDEYQDTCTIPSGAIAFPEAPESLRGGG